MNVDPGILHIVEMLRSEGVETFESCEGGSGHTFAQPTVRFHGDRDEGFRALACALRHGLPVAELRRYWQVVDGEPRGPHWEMTFHPALRAGKLSMARVSRVPRARRMAPAGNSVEG